MHLLVTYTLKEKVGAWISDHLPTEVGYDTELQSDQNPEVPSDGFC